MLEDVFRHSSYVGPRTLQQNEPSWKEASQPAISEGTLESKKIYTNSYHHYSPTFARVGAHRLLSPANRVIEVCV